MVDMLYSINAPHFNAGLIVDKDNKIVLSTAPIIKYMRGWSIDKVAKYTERKRWTLTKIDTTIKK